MKWEKVRLGDIADFRNGINFGKEAYGKGVRLIGVSNFGDRLFPEYKSLDEVKENVVRENDYLCSGDIVFVRSNGNKGLVGRCLLIDSPQDKVTYSGFCIRARINDVSKHYPLFWTYHFKDKAFRKAMSGTAVGANIQNLSQERLAAYEANIPDYKSQVRIADILSSYDKLIENNQKQIKLLEESAQRLYKEWFVDLRFPGYENVEIINGVPEGWSRKCLDEIADIKMGQSPKSEFYNDNQQGMPFHQGVSSYGDRFVEDSTYSTSYTRIADAGSILFSVRAPVGRLNITKNRIVIGRGLAALNHKLELRSFLFYMLKERFFKEDLLGNGSIFSSITKTELFTQSFIYPSENLANMFEDNVSKIDDKISILDDQIRQLIEARDRLLPKLMSGELEV